MKLIFKKFFLYHIQRKLFVERYGEPLIYQLISLFILIFGDFRTKIDFDLVPRLAYAFGIKEAFDIAKNERTKKIVLIEFGVASGGGLFNMSNIAKKLSKIYQIDYEIVGFDTGKGLPAPVDYKDHPEKYFEGDYPSLKLESTKLPNKVKIIYGEIKNTIDSFCKEFEKQNKKIAFISIDVDYYSSTKDCLEILQMSSDNYLSRISTYCDDICHDVHNPYAGVLLAINEFNEEQKLRKICKRESLRYKRIFKTALYLEQMYFVHIFDHEFRNINKKNNSKRYEIKNYEA